MELRQIQYFVALCEEKSVTRAARRLNVVQPAVSMQIAKLEAELGQQLFRRMPKGMMPTEAGAEAYRHFSQVLADIKTARDRLAGFGGHVAGHVSIGTIASVSNNALSECLSRYCTNYPDVSLSVTTGYTADFIDMVRNGQLDVAVINNVKRNVNLPVIRIAPEELVLATAPRQAGGWTGPALLSEIAAMKLVLPSSRHGLRDIIDNAADRAGVFLKPWLEFDDLKTIEEFVATSAYATIIPPVAIHRSLKSGTLVSRQTSPRITRDVVAIYDPRRGLSEAADLLVRELTRTMNAALGREVAQTAPPDGHDIHGT